MHLANRFEADDFVWMFHFILSMLLMSFASVNVGSCASKFDSHGINFGCPELSSILAALRFLHVIALTYCLYYNHRYTTYLKKQASFEEMRKRDRSSMPLLPTFAASAHFLPISLTPTHMHTH
jgi:hypothetical protein